MHFTGRLMTVQHLVAPIVILTLVLVSGVKTTRSTPEETDNYHISYNSSNDKGIVFSTPQECARKCIAGQSPLTCYYHFTLEYYPTMNRACDLCTPNNTNPLYHPPQCQCIEGDGYERTVLSINRMLPGPSIQVCQYDKIIVDVDNRTPGQEATLHWHGLFQQDTQYYDGVPYVTQCPIYSGTSFRYQFIAANPGTFFYHSHSALHKMNGQYGSLIVRQSASVDPLYKLYDEDHPTHVILLSDFFHEMAEERFPGLTNRSPGQMPANLLINGKGRWQNPDTNVTTTSQREIYNVTQGRRYRFRIISAFSTTCLAQFSVQNHSLLLVSQDADPVVGQYVDSIILGSGERVDVILTANQTVGSYWIQLRTVDLCENDVPSQSAIIRYDGASDTPSANEPTNSNPLPTGIVYNDVDFRCDAKHNDTICPNQFDAVVKVDPAVLKVKPDYRFILPVGFFSYEDDVLFNPGTYRHYTTIGNARHVVSIINNITNVFPTHPPISQGLSEFCNGDKRPQNCTTHCQCTHVLEVKRHAVVEVMMYDISEIGLHHPFHLHGYAFHVFDIGHFRTNDTNSEIPSILRKHENKLLQGNYTKAPRKDTLLLPSGGYTLIRFKADNPGWWLFHCHFLWHMMVGMELTVHVGTDRTDLPPVPQYFPRCYDFKPKPYIDEWSSEFDEDFW